MEKRGVRTALVAVDGFTAVTAVAGGALLVTGWEDERFPLEALARTPFPDYVVPGWLLSLVVGGSATVAAVATVRSARAGAWASTGAGAILLGWTIGEELVLDLPRKTTTDVLTDVVYAAAGAAMVVLGVLVHRGITQSSPRADPRGRCVQDRLRHGRRSPGGVRHARDR